MLKTILNEGPKTDAISNDAHVSVYQNRYLLAGAIHAIQHPYLLSKSTEAALVELIGQTKDA